jgi:hypothetical protein
VDDDQVVKVEFDSPPYAITQLDARWLEGTFADPRDR